MNMDTVDADELGRARAKWALGVVAFQPNTEPRKHGDGPDHWWENEPTHGL